MISFTTIYYEQFSPKLRSKSISNTLSILSLYYIYFSNSLFIWKAILSNTTLYFIYIFIKIIFLLFYFNFFFFSLLVSCLPPQSTEIGKCLHIWEGWGWGRGWSWRSSGGRQRGQCRERRRRASRRTWVPNRACQRRQRAARKARQLEAARSLQAHRSHPPAPLAVPPCPRFGQDKATVTRVKWVLSRAEQKRKMKRREKKIGRNERKEK